MSKQRGETMMLTLRELQYLQLEIAKEIKRICDVNNIDYFIIGGTLLGAVRHGGFIPWDDDMDIGMTIENYNRFLELAPSQLDHRFFLQTNATDPNYHNVFAKVRMNGTHMVERVSEGLKIHNGIFVDIFPYDAAPEKLARSKMYMTTLQLLGKTSLLKHRYDLNGITEKRISRIINSMLKSIPIPVKYIDQRLTSLFLSHGNNDEKQYYIERDGMFKGNFVFPQNYFETLEELPFEGIKFKVPSEYAAYLSNAYGEYMKLPPEHEREKGHSVSGIVLENSYEKYFCEEVTV